MSSWESNEGMFWYCTEVTVCSIHSFALQQVRTNLCACRLLLQYR